MALWRIEKAAEYLGIRPKTLYEWVRTGRVPYRKLGFNVRFEPRELEKWAAAQAQGPASDATIGPGSRAAPATARGGVQPDGSRRSQQTPLQQAAVEAAKLLRQLEREVGAHLSFPQRRTLAAVATRLEQQSAGTPQHVRGDQGAEAGT